MSPDWLPTPLELNGRKISDDYEKLYEVYRRTIADCQLTVEGIEVIIDAHPDHSMPEYEAGFMHLVTRSDESGMRTIDYARACKLNWVAPIIEHYQEPEVYSFWRPGPKGETLFLWMPDEDYVVILKWTSKSKNKKIIVTAYSVDSFRRRDFSKYYGQASRILGSVDEK